MIELWRRTQNPWGQDILIGVSWDLMWTAVVLAALFLGEPLRAHVVAAGALILAAGYRVSRAAADRSGWWT